MKRFGNFRINVFFVLVLIFSSLISYRLFVLSYIQHGYYSRTAQVQNERISNVLARGNIYFQDPSAPDGNTVSLAAVNKKYPLAYIRPSDVGPGDADTIAGQAGEILSLPPDKILTVINSGGNVSKVLKRRLTNEEVDRIKRIGVKGVGVSFETDRFYPAEKLAANVLGFLGYGDNGRAGQYGVEAFYEQELSGVSDSYRDYLAPATIRGLFKKENKTDNPDRPADIVLTIDKNIQAEAEKVLGGLTAKWQAESVDIIVQEPFSGKILAMAQAPTFDPNHYSKSPTSYFLNNSVQAIFEPGSSFKPITMLAGLDLKKINPQTIYTDTGFVDVADYRIKNFSDKIFGLSTMSQVLEKSINTGVMFVENLIGDDNFINYIVNMGFGQKTGVDLPGEVSGDINNLYSGRKINYLTASFGQGIAVTPLQLINAYSAIANGGKLVRPYIVEKVIKEGGREEITNPEMVGIPIAEKTSAQLKVMLVLVVDNGFDKARIKGYDVAGKTGTAQIADGKGGYLEDQYIHSFIGFAPAYDPKFVILIKMDKPRGIKFAADSLSPAFREMAEFLIHYYNIPPTRK
ncbi:MAG: hypothetical protein A2750_03965 [Candidatus Yanofskybacteria bacterium RIFCSPHIGHO2_01_FULL_45_42]|uniref:Penicillin-binding protein transpeptidase domain-containing protein n=3 Tax=Candidatus Yanofskyibacteriota TaxID=1752733 RepID=A0A1F8H3F4_9BACT|nr:MAG: hypothetical protein A2750_03965 [Candidatus Yanofskybacteria bacterium RIFCSPHIGHO2_01_FULL_45_42]OGN16038.1 MAG: hypothetical protein A3C81_01845 [Candidatus Yanofskybacteria bacterium RIFCSPHIGHO2_02_FULL_46_19]OGN26163.1 MAG: hypothetical protein A3B17_02290 [Candidatus Yanofskybacteria bacterium RIFCSPLOWO2_01_FULL_45_72]OGN32134.1 MAG: hypothetical protein A3J01_00875 [Candidatus Yanofskybacteria bacterium RIFCSPLOWO2_02_FULL_45_18]